VRKGVTSETDRIISFYRSVWQKSALAKDQLAANHYYDVTKEQAERMFAELSNYISSRLELRPSDSVLEVGCGSGLLLRRIGEKVQYAVGIDFSLGLLKRLNGLDRSAAEAELLPFRDGAFTKVYCHSVLQYFPDLEYTRRSVEEMVQVCKEDGRVFIMDVINGYLNGLREKDIGFYRRSVRFVVRLLLPFYIKRHNL